MSDRTVAGRYALALLQEARRSGEIASVDADVDMLRESIGSSQEFARFLKSPVVSREKKTAVMNQLLSDRLQPLTLRFVQVMIEKEREDILPETLEAYRAHRDAEEGITEATATVAAPIGEAERNQLRVAVEGLTGSKVRLHVKQDPGLIGGIVVRVGDTVYDGSVAHQLVSLREQLLPGRAAVNGTDHR